MAESVVSEPADHPMEIRKLSVLAALQELVDRITRG
jgi:hypothetical protein